MSPEALSAIAGAILSLGMNYIPGLNTAFDRLTANGQRAAMAGLLALAAVGTALWTCTDPASSGHETVRLCLGATNWRAVVQSFVFALMANQATDRISPKERATETASGANVTATLRPMGDTPRYKGLSPRL